MDMFFFCRIVCFFCTLLFYSRYLIICYLMTKDQSSSMWRRFSYRLALFRTFLLVLSHCMTVFCFRSCFFNSLLRAFVFLFLFSVFEDWLFSLFYFKFSLLVCFIFVGTFLLSLVITLRENQRVLLVSLLQVLRRVDSPLFCSHRRPLVVGMMFPVICGIDYALQFVHFSLRRFYSFFFFLFRL